MFEASRLANMANLAWLSFFALGLMLLAWGGAMLLRGAGCPGWSVLGGMLAGLLLGPQFLGALVPRTYEEHVLGGPTQRMELDQMRSRAGADLLAAQAAHME